MTRDEAIAILEMEREAAIAAIQALAAKAEKYDQLSAAAGPTTPSGMVPVYLKPRAKKRRKKPGRPTGHAGVARPRPPVIHRTQEHPLSHCPNCQGPLQDPCRTYQRYVEDLPPLTPEVTAHIVQGYWCSRCRRIITPKVAAALPNSNLGLRVVVLTAWLHYLVGVSVNNLAKILSVFSRFRVSPGGLTQAWHHLARLLAPLYDELARQVSHSAVLAADETGWRLNGVTHWLWCFTSTALCYYLITPGRGSPVVKQFLGTMFAGILMCDFWGAYNKICALAKQRCFYHLFSELVKVDKSNKSAAWQAFRKKLSRLLKDAVRLSKKRPSLTSEDYDRRKIRLYARLTHLVEAGSPDKDAQRLTKRLKRHQQELFTFLEFPGVSPYNNHAEQQMRKPVLVRKVCQQNRSTNGSKAQAILMSLFRSAELQGQNPVEHVLTAAQNIICQQDYATGYFKKAA